jgi:hypothetical protein
MGEENSVTGIKNESVSDFVSIGTNSKLWT